MLYQVHILVFLIHCSNKPKVLQGGGLLAGGVRGEACFGYVSIRVAQHRLDGARLGRLRRAGGRHVATISWRQERESFVCDLRTPKPP